MSSTIEKALQRQREAQKKQAELAAQQATAEPQTTAQRPGQVAARSSVASQHDGAPTQLEPFTLDIERLEQNGHISINGVRKQINEEYREIKRKLINNAFGPISSTLNNSNIIMVTSGRPSEGKTFTACNLAMSIAAEQDKTVLLVDADVLKPNVLNTLGLKRRKGLMEYLTGEVEDISDVLYPTNLDKLKIIPAGKYHNMTNELMSSQKIDENVNEFDNSYPDRIVIFYKHP